MSEDYFYALITGLGILFVFWLIIVVFIHLRKPPKSILTGKLIIRSFSIFLIIFLVLLFFGRRFVF